ncbi:MAG: hypothetical protein GY810_04790 [Aureispira sp.]|nr:hypothetical protein [Aureispira sp.]
MNKLYSVKKLICLLIILLGSPMLWGQTAEEQAKLELKKAQEALLEAKKQEAIAKMSRCDCGSRHHSCKNYSLPDLIAIKSWKVEDENVQGLLAKEAYELSLANNLKPSYLVYEAVYKAINNLQEKTKNNPDFNALDQVPIGLERLGRVRAIKISPDNTKIYTVGSDGYLLGRQLSIYGSRKEKRDKANKPEILAKNNKVSRTLDISPNGQYLASAGDGGSISLFNLEKGEVELDIRFPNQKRIWSLAFLPKENGIVSAVDKGNGKTAIFYTNLKGESTPIIEETDFMIRSIVPSQDGNYLAGVGKSSEVPIWNIKTQKQEFTLKDPRTEITATAVAISPKGRFVVVGYQDGSIRIWDMNKYSDYEEGESPERMLYHNATISDLEFSKDGTILVVGSLDKSATLWTIRDTDHAGEDNDKEFPFEDPRFQPIKFEDHEDWVTSVAFSNDGLRVVTGCADGVLKIWETDMGVYANQICELVDKNLSDRDWRKYIGTDDKESKDLYILTGDDKRRTPLSTCGNSVPQMESK